MEVEILSKADDMFDKLLLDIIENGVSSEGQKVRPIWPDDGSPAHTISKFARVNEYDLSEEFPIHTKRKTHFKNCVREMLWIWRDKSNQVQDLGMGIWDAWADKYGSIGKAYGYQLRQKHIYGDRALDQVDKVLYDLKNDPASRRIMANIYNHADLHDMALAPCVYECIFNVLDGKLYMVVNQRSADLIVAGGWNMTQYAVLQHMLAQVSGLEVGWMHHNITNAHIYDRHIPIAKELLSRPSFPAPKFKMNPDIKNFYDFTIDDFELEDYKAGPDIKGIPVAV
jgi:thymidylate synthase